MTLRARMALVVSLLTGCTTYAPPPHPATAITAFVAAMTNADADALAAIFADDATVFMPFDAVPRRIEGKDEIRSVFERFFDNARKSASAPPYMKLEPRDVTTQLLGDAAIVTFHLGDPAAPSPSVLRLKGDRWVVQHLHASNIRR